MTEPSRAVFVSYASQDSEAARRICDALRTAGIEVWFDQSELRGGDAWDQRIRQQIRNCALFVPIISANTVSRHEGYFRLEWDLADQRTHMIARDRAFIVPVCIDGTPEASTDVPDSFARTHWTRFSDAEPHPGFVQRLSNLLASGAHIAPVSADVTREAGTPRRTSSALALLAIGAVVLGGYFAIDKLVLSRRSSNGAAPTSTFVSHDSAPIAFTPPARSVAVLPFTNLSGDPDQEYLSDGLSEEILNALARIDGLKVAARSSTFSFKGKNVDIAVIARKLNVGTVLEGSVRRSAQKVRVAAQLINATTGFHLWSQTYDNKLSDVLDLQAKVAMAVANQLDVALSGNALAKIGQGGTRNAAAFDAYLRGTHVLAHADSLPEYRRAVAAFDESVARDPNFGAAYALRASALTDMSVDTRDLALLPGIREQARQSAEKAVAFAPELAEAYESRGFVRAIALLDFGAAGPDFERALSLAPGSALVQKGVALYSSLIGHHDVALAADSLAVELDPENHATLNNQFVHLIAARRFPEALRAIHAYEAAGGTETVNEEIGGVYLAMGHPEAALKVCESTRASPNPAYRCLAMAYHALGNHIQAEAALRSNIAKLGDAGAFEYAEIFAQRGELAEALKWLETAARLRLPDIQNIRRDWMLDPVRTEPAYKSIERRFNFPP